MSWRRVTLCLFASGLSGKAPCHRRPKVFGQSSANGLIQCLRTYEERHDSVAPRIVKGKDACVLILVATVGSVRLSHPSVERQVACFRSPPSIPAAFANISLKSRPGTQAWPVLVEKDFKFRGDEFLERPTPLGLLLLQGWLIITHICDKMAYFGISGPENSLVFKVSVLMRHMVALVFALLQLLKYLFGRRPTMMAIKID